MVGTRELGANAGVARTFEAHVPSLRFDVLAHREGPGKASVQIGEITELGACFLGWPEGPQVVFDAICKSMGGSDESGKWSNCEKKMVKN